MSKPKKPPKFKTLAKERDFWQHQDSAEYMDWSKAKKAVFPDLKPSTKTISLRLPENLLNAIKMSANEKDIPYQSLMKILLIQGIRKAPGKHK